MTGPTATVDVITQEIIESSLRAISDEMFATLSKAAMSAIIYEVLDMGTAITDGEGNLATSGAGIPAFVGVLDKAVMRILDVNGDAGAIEPGDIFVTNDPSYGGVTHLNDAVIAMPVFAAGRLIAWTANIAHWNDIGGMVPGSISTDAHEVFQEGLRLPAIKLVSRGEPVEPVMRILEANTRLPEFLTGDLWAAIAAVRLGERRVLGLVERYGADTLIAAIGGFLDHGERVARAALRDLPQGSFRLAEDQDDGSVFRVEIEISHDEIVVDLRDNPDQVNGPGNASRDGSLVAAQMAFMNLIEEADGINGGHFRPLKLLTRPGSVFAATGTAAFGTYYETEIRLHDLIWRCLAPHMNGRLPAGSFASICGTYISGTHPDTGRHFTIVEPQVGGWGATQDGDGVSAMFSAFHGETFNCPAEVAEARYGLFVERLELNPEPGGEGRHRGGKGIVVEYKVRSDGCSFTCAFTRNRNLPWPQDDGLEGSANFAEVVRGDSSVERYAVVTELPVDSGDVIRIHTANGAGYGDPRLREPALVDEDLKNGLLSKERASEVYDVPP